LQKTQERRRHKEDYRKQSEQPRKRSEHQRIDSLVKEMENQRINALVKEIDQLKQTKHDTDIQQLERGLSEIKQYLIEDRKRLQEEHRSREKQRPEPEQRVIQIYTEPHRRHTEQPLSYENRHEPALSRETRNTLQRIQSTPSYNSPDDDYNSLITELFDEAVHQIEHEFHKDLKFERQAFNTLRVITEDFLEELMKKMKSYATKEKRITIMPKDLRRARNELHGSIYKNRFR
jgi:histone H3/H4